MATGRKPNHETQEIRALAAPYAGEAVERLADLMRHGASEATRLAALLAEAVYQQLLELSETRADFSGDA